MNNKNANELVKQQLNALNAELGSTLKADILAFSGPLLHGVDDLFKLAIEFIPNKKRKLVVVLETTGGYIEVVQRIVDTMRHHYRVVDFIVPNFAMSAGTILVMSGDAISMNYYSVLGPIDPQVENRDGKQVPALGYLVQFERLIKKSIDGDLSTAEITFLVEKFDPAELYRYEQARELSVTLLKEWLVKYKFKNWKKTEKRKIKVTKQMKVKRAEKIAKILNDTSKWHSHGRGISMEVLKKDVGLLIEDYKEDKKLNSNIDNYYSLLSDFKMKLRSSISFHVNGKYIGIGEMP